MHVWEWVPRLVLQVVRIREADAKRGDPKHLLTGVASGKSRSRSLARMVKFHRDEIDHRSGGWAT